MIPVLTCQSYMLIVSISRKVVPFALRLSLIHTGRFFLPSAMI